VKTGSGLPGGKENMKDENLLIIEDVECGNDMKYKGTEVKV